MSVLLLEASKFAVSVRPAEPPKRPSHHPWLGRFLSGHLLAPLSDACPRIHKLAGQQAVIGIQGHVMPKELC